MKMMIEQRCIGHSIKKADHFFARLKGLMGKKTLSEGEGLYIYPCNQIHTFGMKMAIDVLFLTEGGKVLHIIHAMPPRNISPIIKGAKVVLELPSGCASEKEIMVGETITKE